MSNGTINVIYGPMFSKKSYNLISIIEATKAENHKYRVFKHLKDTRSDGCITSRKKYKSHPAESIASFSDIKSLSGIEYIFIDEGQFFDNLVDFCIIAKNKGIQIYVAGLDLKFNKEPFGDMPKLIAIADTKTHLRAKCQICKDPADFSYLNKKMVSDINEKIIIGGNDKYMAVCGKCYDLLNK